MGREYQQDLRLVVGVDEVKGGLADPAARDSISGKRGIGYTDADGATQGVSGSPGETLVPTDASDGTDRSEAQADAQINDTSEGVVNADSILNGEMEIGDSLKELQAVDCETGLAMDIFTDEIPPPSEVTADDGDGGETTVSEAWDDATTPPVRADFEAGFRFQYTGNIDDFFSTWGEAMDAQVSAFNEDNPEGSPFSGPWTIDTIKKTAIRTWNWKLVSINSAFTFNFNAGGGSCSIDVDLACPSEGPTELFWPVDAARLGHHLGLTNGTFSVIEFDSEVPADWGGDKGAIDFCTDGGKFGKIEALADGGFAVSERVSDGGALTGNYKVFNSSGTLTSFVADEGIMTQLRPKEPN